MRDDVLTNEDLARALAEYSQLEQRKKDMLLNIPLKNLNSNYLFYLF